MSRRVPAAVRVQRPHRARRPGDRRQLRARPALRPDAGRRRRQGRGHRPARRQARGARRRDPRPGRRVRADRPRRHRRRSRSPRPSPTPTSRSASSTSSSTTPASPTPSGPTRCRWSCTDAVLDTNLRGPWLLSNEVARGLLAAKQPGRIVNIASLGAFNYGGNGAALYSITKAAIHRMTEVLAVEWSRFNINVNCIAPGAFASEMMDGMLGRMGDITQHFPRQRIGRAGAARLDAAVPRVPGVGGRHRHDHQGRRRPGHARVIAVIAHAAQAAARRSTGARGRAVHGRPAGRVDRRAEGQEGQAGGRRGRQRPAPTSSSRAAATARCGPRPRPWSARTRRWPCSPSGRPTCSPTAIGLPTKAADLVALIESGQRRTIDSGVCNKQTLQRDGRRRVRRPHARRGRRAQGAPRHARLRPCRPAQRPGHRPLRRPRHRRRRAVLRRTGDVRDRRQHRHAAAPASWRSPTPRRRTGASTSASSPPPACAEWAGVLAKTIRKRPAASPHTTLGQGTDIDVHLDGDHRYQLDGGSKGTTDRLRFSVRAGRTDTVRSRVLNASTTSANHPQPTARPATMSVSQCTPSRARLVGHGDGDQHRRRRHRAGLHRRGSIPPKTNATAAQQAAAAAEWPTGTTDRCSRRAA